MGLSVHHSVPMKHLLHNCGISGCETSGRRSVSTDNESQILWNFGDSMTFCIHHHHQVTFSLLSHACTCKTCFIPIHVSSSARSEINDVILTKRFACLSTVCWFMSKFSSVVPEKVDIKNFIEEQPRKRAEKRHQSTFCTVTAGLPTGQSWQPAQPPPPKCPIFYHLWEKQQPVNTIMTHYYLPKLLWRTLFLFIWHQADKEKYSPGVVFTANKDV